MKPIAWLFMLFLAAAACRTQRLGQEQGVRAIFEAQAERSGKPPAPATADDAMGATAKHRAPLAPSTNVAPASEPAVTPQTLVAP